MKTNHLNPVQKIIRKLKTINADPMKISYGFAFGVFMSTTPLIGFKWLVALPIVWLVRWNKMACLIGILQVNYITGPFFYTIAYFVGKTVCGYSNTCVIPKAMNFFIIKDIFFGSPDILISLVTGGLILGIPMTIGSFFLVRSVFTRKIKTQLG
jgi:uncharacterized protein